MKETWVPICSHSHSLYLIGFLREGGDSPNLPMGFRCPRETCIVWIHFVFQTWCYVSWEPKGTPPNATFPPRNSRPYEGSINHWFPLIRPAIRAGYFLGVNVALGGSGPVDCHECSEAEELFQSLLLIAIEGFFLRRFTADFPVFFPC